jgi:hypothetical protein
MSNRTDENHSGGALDDFKAFGQKRRVARVHLDVIARSGSHLQADGLAHDEGHGLGFRFAHGGGGHGAALGLVQKFVRRFVNQRGELLGLRLAGKQSNLAAVGDAKAGAIFSLNSSLMFCCARKQSAGRGARPLRR